MEQVGRVVPADGAKPVVAEVQPGEGRQLLGVRVWQVREVGAEEYLAAKSELTQAGAVMGTPAYMSPEQFLGQPVDGRSDLFSCGVVLYQFLTGEKPFTGTTTTIMYKVLQEEPLAPSKLNVGLPGAFDDVMKKAIAKSPGDRYATAQEFAEDLLEA